jgi:hypothetical protein
MDEWIVQWYAYVPALVNGWLNVEPLESVPLSNEPSSAVTVCEALPVFVQVTVVPTLTVVGDGWNPKSTIVAGVEPPAGASLAAAALAAAVAAGATVAAGAEVDADPAHAARRTARTATIIGARARRTDMVTSSGM